MLRELLDNTVKSLNLANAFAFAPVLHFKTNKVFCPRCHTKLKVHHTDTRKIYLLDIGQCKAHRSFMYCPDCECVFPNLIFPGGLPCSKIYRLPVNSPSTIRITAKDAHN